MTNADHETGADQPAAKKRGPKPSGVPRSEVLKLASKNRRTRLLESGKVELKVFVEPGTKSALERIKASLGLSEKSTMGEVLDALVQHHENKP